MLASQCSMVSTSVISSRQGFNQTRNYLGQGSVLRVASTTGPILQSKMKLRNSQNAKFAPQCEAGVVGARDPEKWAKMVAANRMLTTEEETLRKIFGPSLAIATVSYLMIKGPAHVSVAWTAAGFYAAFIFTISGFWSQCGCAVMLRWKVDVLGKASDVPPEHKDFMRRKRTQLVINYALSTVAATAVTCGIFYYLGLYSPTILVSAIKGILIAESISLIGGYFV